jgi:hypothetical protein
METGNPELQGKLQQLELEFQASCSVYIGRRRVLGFDACPSGMCVDTSGMLGMDTNLWTRAYFCTLGGRHH